MDTEKIILDIPKLDGDTPPAEAPKKRKNLAAMITASLLAAVSLVLHAAVIAEAVELLKNEGSEFLFSNILPEYEISEPLTPKLPEEDTVEEDGTDIPSDILFRDSDLSTGVQYGLAITNETEYAPDLIALHGLPSPTMSYNKIEKEYGKGSPKVLIYHTHATEAYRDTVGTGFRTDDSERNMIAVGEVICTVLEKAGIETVHLKEQFDAEDWSAAYDNSHSAVLDTLEKYPSIQYVFDVHRDCIGNDTDGYVRSTTQIFGRDTAQLMFVCGTDEGGSGHKEWRDNLTFALRLQSSLWKSCDSLMRPVNLRRASFYQDTRSAALLLECGTCANTLSEAKRGAVLFASSLANYIRGDDAAIDEEEMIESLCP